MRKHEGGAEVELTMLFADLRGSVTSSSQQSTRAYSQWIQKLYLTASHVLIQRETLVNRLMGDQVIGLFVLRLVGPEHSVQAVGTGIKILQETGHADAGGAWVPVGVGIHRGTAYVGAVGSGKRVNEIAILGEAANFGARLSSHTRPGEVLVSQAVIDRADQWDQAIEKRTERLKRNNRTCNRGRDPGRPKH